MKAIQRKQSVRKQRSLTWHGVVNLGAVVYREPLKLAVAVVQQPGTANYGAMAIETPSSVETIRGVLDTHAHRLIGMYKSLGAALKAAERYAARWLASKKSLRACDCKEMES